MIGQSSSGAFSGAERDCHVILQQRDKLNKHSKSAIQLELDVNGVNDEESLKIAEIEQYEPARTPSVLCSQTHFHLENLSSSTIVLVIHNVLSQCEEISYEYNDIDFKVRSIF